MNGEKEIDKIEEEAGRNDRMENETGNENGAMQCIAVKREREK